MRTIRRGIGRLRLDWRAGLRRLPFFTQRTAVLLVGVLVATLALLGGVVALVGMPGSRGPTHLVPGGKAGEAPPAPVPGGADAPGDRGPATAAGPRPGGQAAASQAPGPSRPGQAPARPTGELGTGLASGGAAEPGGAAAGAQGSGGAAGAGAGGPPAAPPTNPTTTTVPPGPLQPVDDLLGPVVSTLLP